MPTTLLDTHAWVWWVTADRRLSKPASRAVRQAQADGALWLSLISIWEVAKKVEKGQLALDRPVDEWLDQATSQEGLQLAELTRPILMESCRLPPPFHGDPADQLIVASARDRDAIIVTKDDRIRRYAHVRTIW
jgi:PIN domain nuclease of toxin-antitoxin system